MINKKKISINIFTTNLLINDKFQNIDKILMKISKKTCSDDNLGVC